MKLTKTVLQDLIKNLLLAPVKLIELSEFVYMTAQNGVLNIIQSNGIDYIKTSAKIDAKVNFNAVLNFPSLKYIIQQAGDEILFTEVKNNVVIKSKHSKYCLENLINSKPYFEIPNTKEGINCNVTPEQLKRIKKLSGYCTGNQPSILISSEVMTATDNAFVIARSKEKTNLKKDEKIILNLDIVNLLNTSHAIEINQADNLTVLKFDNTEVFTPTATNRQNDTSNLFGLTSDQTAKIDAKELREAISQTLIFSQENKLKRTALKLMKDSILIETHNENGTATAEIKATCNEAKTINVNPLYILNALEGVENAELMILDSMLCINSDIETRIAKVDTEQATAQDEPETKQPETEQPETPAEATPETKTEQPKKETAKSDLKKPQKKAA